MNAPLPRAARPFVEFPALLRTHGFAVAPEQTTSFLRSIELLGPRGIEDIRRAGLATLAPPPERRADFDALFRAHFLNEAGLVAEPGESEDDEVRVQEDDRGISEPPMAEVIEVINEAGQAATSAEALSARRFAPFGEDIALRRLARLAPDRLPRRRGYRQARAKRGAAYDLRRTLREAIRNEGDVMRLPRLRRKTRRRNILLLIDVSGSMKERTDAHLRFAHTLARAAERIEIFTFGTRLTRITRAMRLKNADQALATASRIVSDWDGGTRIGDALQAFLAVPRFAGYARGAVTLILSDGLERGDPAAMADAVARLARRSWRLDWLTPLASDPAFAPRTEALKSILPFIDELADGGSTPALCAHVLALAERRAA